jgi:hypothetical protein
MQNDPKLLVLLEIQPKTLFRARLIQKVNEDL